MAIYRHEDLAALWGERSGFYAPYQTDIDKMLNVYKGILPQEFADYFNDDMHLHVINTIRLAWDDLTTMAGKEFPVYVRPDNESPTAKERAERQEKIAYGYNRAGRIAGGISMKMLAKVLMWWLVGTANAVGMILPDYKHKGPYFTFRDPRQHFPPVGWTPYNQTAQDDALFAYPMTVGELKRRYPAQAEEIDQKIVRFTSTGHASRVDDSTVVWIGEYYTADTWMVATLTQDRSVLLARSDTGDPGHPDVMPVVSFGLYDPSGALGRSMFADQISIQAAMARMFSQKLDFYDRTLYPIIFHTPLAGPSVRIGPYAMNEYNPAAGGGQPRLDVVQPAHPVDADQTMAFALGMSRMLNRNPEMMQGGGQADSAKAINELKSGITATVRDMIWPPFLEVLPTMYQKAAEMDVNLWGGTSKKIHGERQNQGFVVEYTPRVALAGRESDFEVEAGLGLAGYQGTLEILQIYGAELISEDDALEQLEHVRDAQDAKRKIQRDRIAKLQFADLAAKAQGGGLVPGALSEIAKRVEGGEDLFEVIADLEKRQGLMLPPAPPMGMPGAAPGGAGPAPGQNMPPAASMLPLPTMMALRGGPGPKRA